MIREVAGGLSDVLKAKAAVSDFQGKPQRKQPVLQDLPSPKGSYKEKQALGDWVCVKLQNG